MYGAKQKAKYAKPIIDMPLAPMLNDLAGIVLSNNILNAESLSTIHISYQMSGV